MDILFNYGFAWIAVVFTVLSSIIYVLRKVIIKNKLKGSLLNKLNRFLRKYHKHMGIIVVIAGLIHGLFSSEKVLSINLGTIALILSILLGLNWSIRKWLSKHKSWMYYHRLLTVAFIVTIGLHIYDVGGIQMFNILFDDNNSSSQVYVNNSEVLEDSNNTEDNVTVPDDKVEAVAKELMDGNYNDGTYTGEATAYRAGLVVQIEIKDNTLTSIQIIDHNEVNSRYYQKAFDTIPERIMDNQSTTVDVTSGATFSSIGIMNAVNNALAKAIISGDLPTDQSLPANRGHGH